MNYLSTRGQVAATGLSAALAAGLAPDGGLYVPERLPFLQGGGGQSPPYGSPGLRECGGHSPPYGVSVGLEAFDGADSLPAIAACLLRPFFAGDALAGELPAICTDALDIPAPLRALPDGRSWMLELFHGPTAAFKDFGARFLAAALARIDAGKGERTVLVATSGDTGAAVAAAFHRRPGFRVAILYPDGKVSPRQAHQLGCFGDNVQALRVAGTFDDCQALVKQALNDAGLAARLRLTSANSISLGRLLPQMTYYAQASLQHFRAHRRPLGFIVPTGNLGNALAAVLARRCGLPIGPIALATNANRGLADFFAGADYAPRASVATLANAMDVGAPSNFERLRWLYPDSGDLRHRFDAGWVSDAEISDVIATSQTRYGATLCPHTATAARMYERLRQAGDDADYALVATAHPAKFEQIVEPLIGAAVAVPASLGALLQRPAHAHPLAPRFGALVAALDG